MLSLSTLFWITFAIALVSFWWQSDLIKSLALNIALNRCREDGVQLLDQTMVIRGIWPARDNQGSLKLRRKYVFEFSSTGEQRYRGIISMVGKTLQHIELEPYVIP